MAQKTPEQIAFREKLVSMQFSTIIRTSDERSLDRVTNMPREEFYAMKERVDKTPNLKDIA